MGHNVLQLGTAMPDTPPPGTSLSPVSGWQLSHYAAPVTPPTTTVHALNSAGGRITVDATGCYERLSRWRRIVAWSEAELSLEDDVILSKGQRDIVLFRWHLGTREEVAIEDHGMRFVVTWAEMQCAIEASRPIQMEQVQLPDRTLRSPSPPDQSEHLHTCLVVRSRDEVDAIALTIHVQPILEAT